MAVVLPSTVQELNSMQLSPPSMYVLKSNQDFENISTEKRIKREVSLPTGVENWNISNFESYLNFEDNYFEDVQSADDRLVPEGYQRGRCESISSVASSMDEKHLVYHSLGVKSFKTVNMDSGSTCFSTDHSYLSSTPSALNALDVEETYQNLDMFLQQVPDLTVTDTMSSSFSSVSSPAQENKFELSALHDSFALQGSSSRDSFDTLIKRSAETNSDDESLIFNPTKRLCEAPTETRYYEHRRKNNIASKNCRKTRKEKQKEMESRITDLEKEREDLNKQVQVLEQMIQSHKVKIFQILQR